MNKLTKLGIIIGMAGMLFGPALSYAQSIGTSTTTTIGYFYSASGTMINSEDNNGAMSSYLTRGIRNNGTTETFIASNIKDVTGLIDADGNVLNKYTYTAYGVPTSYSFTSINSTLKTKNSTLSLSSNPYTYSNYYTDSESGNYYLNARYYDPTLGVFLTSDTYNLPNRNMYVKGNPVMGVDPTGHWWKLTGTFRWGTWGETEKGKPENFEAWRNNRAWYQSTSKDAYYKDNPQIQVNQQSIHHDNHQLIDNEYNKRIQDLSVALKPSDSQILQNDIKGLKVFVNEIQNQVLNPNREQEEVQNLNLNENQVLNPNREQEEVQNLNLNENPPQIQQQVLPLHKQIRNGMITRFNELANYGLDNQIIHTNTQRIIEMSKQHEKNPNLFIDWATNTPLMRLNQYRDKYQLAPLQIRDLNQ